RQLRVNVNLDLFADHHRRSLRTYAEVFAIDSSGRRETATLGAALLKGRRRAVYVERDFLSHTVNRKITHDFKLALAILAHTLRLEGNGWELRRVEVVRTLQIVIAAFGTSVDGIHIHGRVHARLRNVVIVDNRRAARLHEPSMNIADAHVAHCKSRRGVSLIDLPF